MGGDGPGGMSDSERAASGRARASCGERAAGGRRAAGPRAGAAPGCAPRRAAPLPCPGVKAAQNELYIESCLWLFIKQRCNKFLSLFRRKDFLEKLAHLEKFALVGVVAHVRNSDEPRSRLDELGQQVGAQFAPLQ